MEKANVKGLHMVQLYDILRRLKNGDVKTMGVQGEEEG